MFRYLPSILNMGEWTSCDLLMKKKPVYNFVPSVWKHIVLGSANESPYNFGLKHPIMPQQQQTYNMMSICVSVENISV